MIYKKYILILVYIIIFENNWNYYLIYILNILKYIIISKEILINININT